MTLTEWRYILAFNEIDHAGRTLKTYFSRRSAPNIAIKELEYTLDILSFKRSHGHIPIVSAGKHRVTGKRGVTILPLSAAPVFAASTD